MSSKQPIKQSNIQCQFDSGFAEWVSQCNGSICATSNQANKVLMIGWTGDQLSLLMRNYDKPMGLDYSNGRLAISTSSNVVIHSNDSLLAPHYEQKNKYDALYTPKASWHTGDLNIHDIAFGEKGLWFVNTKFNCLAQVSVTYTFIPRWQPFFIDEINKEDCCHINGLAMSEGKPKYVTCLGNASTSQGWRDLKENSGIVMDVQHNTIILEGLTMPHSPRVYRKQLYVLNSGEGELLRIDPETNIRKSICTLPGYLRGLAFSGDHALVGLSKIRESGQFRNMPIQACHSKLICGIAIVNIITGEQCGLFEFDSGCEELFDIRFLAQTQRPMILSNDNPETAQLVTTPENAYWMKPD